MADVDVKLPPFERLALDFQALVPKDVFQESVRFFVKIRSLYLFRFERYISKLRRAVRCLFLIIIAIGPVIASAARPA